MNHKQTIHCDIKHFEDPKILKEVKHPANFSTLQKLKSK